MNAILWQPKILVRAGHGEKLLAHGLHQHGIIWHDLNCPITPEAVINANTFFGPKVESLKGKNIRKTSDTVATEYVEITQTILDLNNKVTLASDVMFVNGLDLFVSTLRRIKFTTIRYTPKSTKGKLISPLNKSIIIYNASGFNIRTSLMDWELYRLIPNSPGLNINQLLLENMSQR